ncbi:MAG: arylsulfatase [Paludibacter sp.]|nr:arylsulfatase [Paludibacter sp.]
MNKKIMYYALSGLTATASVVLAQTDLKKPNYIVILVDDLGYTDFSCYGGVIPTPNIDKLAERGVRMSQMYNAARSCPTRASLLTGLYPQQAGVGYMTGELNENARFTGSKSYQGHLNETSVTIAEVMAENGYFTAMAGKWHLGNHKDHTPRERGFHRSLHGRAGGFFFPEDPKAILFLDDKRIQNDDPRLPRNWYSTDLWTHMGLEFINEAIASKKPFMLYLAHNAPHFPLQAPESEIAKFKGKFSKGWDVLRQEIYERQLKMNLFGKPYPLSKKNPFIPNWDDVDPQQKKISEHTMEIYAATVKIIDDNVGRLVDELKKKGVFDNTIIMILSDNGGNAEGRTVFGTYNGEKPGQINSTVFVGQAWAEMSNTPFYLYKHHTHEGGIATPCIVSYPNGIPKPMHGKVVHEPGHLIDIMATLVESSGAKYPAKYNKNTITPMQGVSLLPVWQGKDIQRQTPIFWEHEGNVALRNGKWKLVKEKYEETYQLYDMENDRTEMNDLSLKEPLKFAEMMQQFNKMYDEIGAKPFEVKTFRWFVPVLKY